MKKSKETKKSMVDIMKDRISKSAGGANLFLKFKDNERRRIRFLSDIDDAILVTFHDNFNKGVGNPCYKYFGRKNCPFCGKSKEDGYRTRDMFILSVFDYESGEVKLVMEAANDCSPIPHMVENYEENGTLLNRDYIVKRRGKSFDTSYTLIGQAEKPFKGARKFKALDEDEVFESLKERYLEKMKELLNKIKDGTFDDDGDLDDDEDVKQKSRRKKPSKIQKSKYKKTKFSKYYDEDDDDLDEDLDDDLDDDEDDEFDEDED